MGEYDITHIRNLAFAGEGGVGKTSLAEAILFDTGVIDRLGKVGDGSSFMDYDPDEIKRRISINAALGFCEWKKHLINLIDTPGYANFMGDTIASLRVVDAVVILVGAVTGVKVQTEKLWGYADELHLPKIVFINEMDRDRASFERTITDLQRSFASTLVPLQIPIGEESDFRGMVDLLGLKAMLFDQDTSGKFQLIDIPGDIEKQAVQGQEESLEVIVEGNDTLLEKYLDRQSLSSEEVGAALREGVLSRRIVPVLLGSGLKNIGIQPLLDTVIGCLPSPVDGRIIQGEHPQGKGEETRKAEIDELFSALVFKTIADPYAGKLTLFRVFSGVLNADSTVFNVNRQVKERFGQLYHVQGKTQKPVPSVSAGEIAAVAKLKVTATGDTLSDEKAPLSFPAITFPHPVMSFAIVPKTKGDEEKVTAALSRLIEEDPTLKMGRDPQTKEMVISGLGEVHIEVAVDRLKRKFGVEVDVKIPRIPYKETIKSSAKVQGKYKRQSGGRGQYGDTWLHVESLPRGKGFEFVDNIVGGVIPRQYIPAVEKGIREAMDEGVLAGYPVMDVKVTLYDGSFHAVDSSEMAFKIAASMGFKKGMAQAQPVLLEPLMRMEVVVPDENLGDVIGDLNAKRGRVLGVEAKSSKQFIKALVPMSEVLTYASGLRSMTGGRGGFTAEFSHYEEVPAHLAEKIIREAQEQRKVD